MTVCLRITLHLFVYPIQYCHFFRTDRDNQTDTKGESGSPQSVVVKIGM